MTRTFKKIWKCITSVLVALVVIVALLLVGARLTGLQVFTVLSGSMEPAYHVGSLIYVKDVDPFELESGDVITFMLDENTVATHRIVEVVPDEEDDSVVRFRTKGDANENVDGSLVHYKNVIGSPVFTIPYLGYAVSYIQNPPGTYVAISAGAILLLLVFLPDLFDGDKKKKKNTGDTDAYIRVKLVTYMADSEGNPIAKNASIPPFDPGSDWFYCESDDTYYYGKPVAPGDKTSDLIGSDGITLKDGQVVEVLAEGIQSVPDNAVEEAWPAVEVVDGVLQVKEAGA